MNCFHLEALAQQETRCPGCITAEAGGAQRAQQLCTTRAALVGVLCGSQVAQGGDSVWPKYSRRATADSSSFGSRLVIFAVG